MADEKITANEWDKRKQCPICQDIAERNIDLAGEVMTHPVTHDALHCPVCDYPETRLFHDAVVESKRSAERGDTQPWNHLLTVKCESCKWKHVVANNVCLGDPWDEVFGFRRQLDQTDQQKHALTWSNEEAVGLRGVGRKYNKNDELLGRGYKAERKITTEKGTNPGKIEWVPTKEERKLPRFKKKDES